MAEPNSIITPQTARNAYAVTDTANVVYTDLAVAVLLANFTVLSRLTRLQAMQRATNTAMNLQLYLSKDAGVTKRLITTRLLPAFTVGNTTAIPILDFGISDGAPMFFAPGDSLYVAQSVTLAGGCVWYAEWGEY